MKYEGFAKIMALDLLVSEHIDRNEGDFLHYCPPKFLAKGMSTKLLQKPSANFIFLTPTTSWPLGITAQNTSAYAQNFSLFSLHHTNLYLMLCPVSAFSCLPSQCSQRRLCGHRGGSGDHICASCSRESLPKTQSGRHWNSPEMQEVR